MRDRHRKEAMKQGQIFADLWLRQNGFKAGMGNKKAQQTTLELVKEHCWRAYLNGGHKGDWGHLESILKNKLAR